MFKLMNIIYDVNHALCDKFIFGKNNVFRYIHNRVALTQLLYKIVVAAMTFAK